MRLRAPIAGMFCAAALAAGLLASGCGSSSVSGTLDPVAQAAEATTHSGGAHLAMNMTMSFDGHQAGFSGQGTLDPSRREGQITMDMSAPAGLSEGALPAGTTMTELFKGDSLYVGSSAFAGKLPGGARWMKVDLGKVAGKLGIDPQALTSGESNPADFLKELDSVSGSVRQTGTATVRGVPTTVYTATIDLTKAAEKAGQGNSKVEQALKSVFGKAGLSTVPVQVWVDSKHMVRKLQMQMNMSVSGQTMAMTVVEELFDFGAVPGVNAPSSSETYEPQLPSLGSL